ncbi:prepilin peptidase [Microvirga terricola]|uniref:Prepilin peptidase n=1 Tax=Microvirga terricola TaxID=2719797 RepID=A0ABX0VF17_9HYPH|nr:A24 family peptidase [Microvirga terricola]NIX78430.1 prepilin peptidase [Microvirga terricola]
MPSELPLLAVFAAYLVTVLLVSAVIDARHFIIPNTANAANLAGALAFAFVMPQSTLASALLGGLIGGGAFVALAAAFRRIRRYDGLGLGDAKFMLGAGAWVGWQGLAPLVFVASSSALVYVALRRKMGEGFDPQAKIPFAPFLCAATLTVWSLQIFGYAPWLG